LGGGVVKKWARGRGKCARGMRMVLLMAGRNQGHVFESSRICP
jgi:hypothetical protein